MYVFYIMGSREKCVIDGGDLELFAEFSNFPIKCCIDSGDQPFSWDMKLGRCTLCGSINQMNLLDPTILYGGKYPLDTSYSPTWISHHQELASFLRGALSPGYPIIEIGSSSLVLAEKLVEDYADYTIFDFSLETTRILPSFRYIEGNCETYSFPSRSCIVMSHVFEHLYEPRKFIENCKKFGVENIIISIPNMDDVTRTSITREHTYTYSSSDIVFLFEVNGYALGKIKNFGINHSIFYHFVISDDKTITERILNSERWKFTSDYLNQSFTIPPNTYLVGAGFWSQITYHNIVNKENIIGVIDNDVTKQGRTYYGTNFTIQKFDILKNVQSGTSVIVLANKYWTKEVTDHIKSINSDINIVSLT
jgi:hypothetical protein